MAKSQEMTRVDHRIQTFLSTSQYPISALNHPLVCRRIDGENCSCLRLYTPLAKSSEIPIKVNGQGKCAQPTNHLSQLAPYIQC